MKFYTYLIYGYLIIINIIAFSIYLIGGKKSYLRLPELLFIIPPLIGGSLGAVIGNYFFNTEHRENRSWLHKILGYLPPMTFIIQIFTLYIVFNDKINFMSLWNAIYNMFGLFGSLLLIINIISFILIIIRKSSKYIAPVGNYLIPDFILIPIIVLGGSFGAAFAKILFNFKEDWSCNSLKVLQNFIYNNGMFIIAIFHIVIFAYIYFI